MHYTSIENIHKVIDPLFLSELKTEFNGLIKNFEKAKSAVRDRKKHITESQIAFEAFRDKLASLTFLDIKTPRLIQLNYSSADFAA